MGGGGRAHTHGGVGARSRWRPLSVDTQGATPPNTGPRRASGWAAHLGDLKGEDAAAALGHALPRELGDTLAQALNLGGLALPGPQRLVAQDLLALVDLDRRGDQQAASPLLVLLVLLPLRPLRRPPGLLLFPGGGGGAAAAAQDAAAAGR